MVHALFSAEELRQICAHGLTEDMVLAHIAQCKRGIPYTTLHRPCMVGDGITVFQQRDLVRLATPYSNAALSGRAMKFTPASGAASRMFKLLLSWMSRADLAAQQTATTSAAHDPEYREFLQCLHNIQRFAFYDDLQSIMAENSLNIATLLTHGHYKSILEYLLTPVGLNYANLPKALLKFHRYPDHCRTPLEEHLVEAAAYAQDRNGKARLHFTVTPAHQEAMQDYIEHVRSRYEHSGMRYDISFSTQKPSTDTIAVDLENRPFHDQQGKLLFRPAGHGALLENLHALEADIVFIKNIDNVVPDHLKEETYVYKRALGGYLVEVQNQMFAYLHTLATGDVAEQLLTQIFAFARDTLAIVPPAGMVQRSAREKRDFLFDKLNRPLRVCGMVQNAGEPGGGPFWVEHADGSLSLQIVETSQVDMTVAEQRALVAAATHFNPVDLVCGVRDYRGQPFHLMQYTDPDAGFISIKSHEGRELKALELPGLWNGAMANWNTVFVEVPLSTFNPVKTVLDLLRPQHQS